MQSRYQNKQDKPLNKWYKCPLTNQIMRDPVILFGSGITYEKTAIEEWLQKNSIDPTTRKELLNNLDKTLVPNQALQNIIGKEKNTVYPHTSLTSLQRMIFWRIKPRHQNNAPKEKQQSLRSKI